MSRIIECDFCDVQCRIATRYSNASKGWTEIDVMTDKKDEDGDPVRKLHDMCPDCSRTIIEDNMVDSEEGYNAAT